MGSLGEWGADEGQKEETREKVEHKRFHDWEKGDVREDPRVLHFDGGPDRNVLDGNALG